MNIQDENSVTIQLGKKGLSETFYMEIAKNLRQNKLVKVKILKNAIETPDEEGEETQISKDKHSYSDEIINELRKKHNFEHKLVGRTLFLKKVN